MVILYKKWMNKLYIINKKVSKFKNILHKFFKYNNIKITLVNYKIMQQLIFCLDIIQTVNYGIRAWLNYKNSGIGREVFISI